MNGISEKDFMVFWKERNPTFRGFAKHESKARFVWREVSKRAYDMLADANKRAAQNKRSYEVLLRLQYELDKANDTIEELREQLKAKP